jgi:hypothetical protein
VSAEREAAFAEMMRGIDDLLARVDATLAAEREAARRYVHGSMVLDGSPSCAPSAPFVTSWSPPSAVALRIADAPPSPCGDGWHWMQPSSSDPWRDLVCPCDANGAPVAWPP